MTTRRTRPPRLFAGSMAGGTGGGSGKSPLISRRIPRQPVEKVTNASEASNDECRESSPLRRSCLFCLRGGRSSLRGSGEALFHVRDPGSECAAVADPREERIARGDTPAGAERQQRLTRGSGPRALTLGEAKPCG